VSASERLAKGEGRDEEEAAAAADSCGKQLVVAGQSARLAANLFLCVQSSRICRLQQASSYLFPPGSLAGQQREQLAESRTWKPETLQFAASSPKFRAES